MTDDQVTIDTIKEAIYNLRDHTPTIGARCSARVLDTIKMLRSSGSQMPFYQVPPAFVGVPVSIDPLLPDDRVAFDLRDGTVREVLIGEQP